MISVNEEIIDINDLFKKKYHLKKLLQEKNISNNYDVINVVGTNGKGSVSNFISQGLQKKYSKVGLFTSPAFLFHNERVQINGTPISDDDLIRILDNIKNNFSEYELTFFEIWTLIAFIYFNKNNIDIAVIEAGIGGMYDSTKHFSNQIAVVVTSIDLDHVEILGYDIKSIIEQKLGIINNKKAKIFLASDNIKYISNIKETLKHEDFVFADDYSKVSSYQKINSGLALKVLNYFGINENDFDITKTPLGRFTILKKYPHLILDGSHNVDGIRKMISSIKEISDDFTVLFATSKEKDYTNMFELLNNNFKNIFVTDFNHFKSWKVPKELSSYKVESWKEFIDSFKGNLIVCGSLYFIPQVYEYLSKGE